jgi:predicted RNA-binding protein YlxR (DUF448 family)
MTTPLRTCVGCGRTRPQSELVRFVAQDGALTPDRERRSAGRGVYTCRAEACFERARRQGSFPRALRTDVRVPEVLNQVFEEV